MSVVPVFSIIVPVYNVAAYLEAALNSLLGQSFHDFEVVLVNDGSTDSSGNICDGFVLKDERFSVLHQENQGQSIARNNGFKLSKGKYIYYFDADDLLDGDALVEWLALFVEFSVDSILFGATVFSDSNIKNERLVYQRGVGVVGESRESSGYVFDSLRLETYFPSPCCYVTARKFLSKISFNESVIHEDNTFYLDLFLQNSLNIRVVDKPYFKRRLRPDSTMTSTKTIKNILGFQRCFDESLEKYMASNDSRYLAFSDSFQHQLIEVICLVDNGAVTLQNRKRILKNLQKLFIAKSYRFKTTIASLFPELYLLRIKGRQN
ncbi:MAG: glycosyltransferase [Colwellia sp.]|jgi:Glycosyltransferases involved in cell wall biogenesis